MNTLSFTFGVAVFKASILNSLGVHLSFGGCFRGVRGGAKGGYI